jgi:hypothetical protein
MIDKNIIITAIIVSLVYVILRIIEIKFINKEELNFKLIIKDALIVLCSVIAGFYLSDQLKPMMYENANSIIKAPVIFTDAPNF